MHHSLIFYVHKWVCFMHDYRIQFNRKIDIRDKLPWNKHEWSRACTLTSTVSGTPLHGSWLVMPVIYFNTCFTCNGSSGYFSCGMKEKWKRRREREKVARKEWEKRKRIKYWLCELRTLKEAKNRWALFSESFQSGYP